MATLEYILLAEYARQDPGGAVTIVAANVDTVVAPYLPAQHHLAVVGRANLEPGEEPPTLKISIAAPDNGYMLTSEQLMAAPAGIVEGLPVAASFIGNVLLPLTAYGIYTITASLDDAQGRALHFRVIDAPPDVAAER